MTLPSGWRRVHLRDVAEVRSGVAKNSKKGGLRIARPYLRVANVQDGHVDLREIKTIEVAPQEASRYELLAGDVLMTEGGDFDKLGRGTVWRAEIPGCLHQNHVFAVRPDRSQVLPEFLSLWTRSRVGRRYFARCSKQTTNLASINSSQVKAAPIFLPRLTQQHWFASLASDMDRAERSAHLLLEAKRRLKLGFVRYLMDCTGSPPVRARLDEHARESHLRNSDGLGRDRVMGVIKGAGLQPMRDRIRVSDLKRYKVVPPDAFAYNPMRINIGSIARNRSESSCLVSPDYVVFHCNSDTLLPAYLDHLRETRTWENFMESAGAGSVRVRIYYRDLGRMRIPLPPIEEQRRVVSVLDSMDREIDALQRLATSYQRQRRAVVDKLLSGELAIPDP